jgi:hypothetical protein
LSADVRAEIREQRALKERKLAVCCGSIPLDAPDRAELLVILTEDSDGDIAERAMNAALDLPAEDYVAALAREDCDKRLFAYCASEIADRVGIADALAKNRNCPRDLLPLAASHFSSTGIWSVLDDLDSLSMSPELAESLAGTPHATPEQMELIAELNTGATCEVTQEAAAEVAASMEEGAKEAEPDPVRRKTLVEQIAKMTVVQRMQLAIKGPREARMTLIRDTNKIIQRAVLQSPRLTDKDVESFAAMTHLSGEVLRVISNSRVFMKSHTVLRNLVNNPKTPLDVSLRLFPHLLPAEVKALATNKNIPETLRALATKQTRERNAPKQQGE